jgi:hypothetical protein
MEIATLILSVLKLAPAMQQALAAWLSATPNPTQEQIAGMVAKLDVSDAAREDAVDRFKAGL